MLILKLFRVVDGQTIGIGVITTTGEIFATLEGKLLGIKFLILLLTLLFYLILFCLLIKGTIGVCTKEIPLFPMFEIAENTKITINLAHSSHKFAVRDLPVATFFVFNLLFILFLFYIF